ncbi:MAG: glycosyltransferase family 4 protein [Archaeoglobus sp.]|uniref:glycosyltransferase family 4 protein n=1 Tax=Archaeoglobus sp. TaxID=1872626 RepID=UPI001DB3E878|nr:glycosyltransferase family 4 protein [Archaeoglobus sp.]MBO8180437.1 glycosyltransferase family 4 protein [Archaeoglobus sp.]
MRILFISGREPTYTRNAVILKGLKKCGIEVIECTDCSKSYAVRYPKVIINFLLKLMRKDTFDAVFVGFFGQPLVKIVRKALKDKSIVFDAFLSAYDTMCFERKNFRPNSIAGKFFYWLDKSSCEIADTIILDTNAHIDYFVNTFNLPKEKFHRVFVGADDEYFYPRNVERNDGKFRVFYYGTYRPLQGIEYIIKAAKLLEPYEDIEFIVVGKGPERGKIDKLARDLNVKNVRFIDWIPYEKLPVEIAKSDVCLGGHFSNIDKAKRVIAGKTFQFIAMKKPVIVGDNPANRELFEDRENALFVEIANSDALAKGILELRENEDFRENIAEKGYRTFMEKCTPEAIGRELYCIIREVVG